MVKPILTEPPPTEGVAESGRAESALYSLITSDRPPRAHGS